MAKSMFVRALMIGALGSGIAGNAVAADDLMTGASASMLADTCYGCHGVHGVSSGPAIPSLAGMSAVYLEETMAAYASGDRPSTIMQRIAKGYTKDEVKLMAAEFAGHKAGATPQTVDAEKAKKGAKIHDKYCEKCHSEGGSVAEDDASILAGQPIPYLHWALADYMSGAATAPKKMRKKLKEMHEKEGDAGVEALTHYYASQQ
jgi:sulfide dehydrogenase cytochrome subunit